MFLPLRSFIIQRAKRSCPASDFSFHNLQPVQDTNFCFLEIYFDIEIGNMFRDVVLAVSH
jgi:hypothetical protein